MSVNKLQIFSTGNQHLECDGNTTGNTANYITILIKYPLSLIQLNEHLH